MPDEVVQADADGLSAQDIAYIAKLDAEEPVDSVEPVSADAEVAASEAEKPGESETAETAESEESEERVAPTKDHEKAVAALKRDGWTDEELSAMDEAKLLQRAQQRQKVHAGIDKAFDLASKASKTGESGEQKPEGRTPASGDPASNRDLDTALAKLTELYGDDAGAAFKTALNSVVQPLQQQMQLVTAHLEGQLEKALRADLTGTYPQAATDEGYQSVRDAAMDLLKTERFSGDFAGALKAAAMLEFGAPTKPASKADSAVAAAKKAGSMTINGTKPKDREKTADQKGYEAFMLMESGLSPLEARNKIFGN